MRTDNHDGEVKALPHRLAVDLIGQVCDCARGGRDGNSPGAADRLFLARRHHQLRDVGALTPDIASELLLERPRATVVACCVEHGKGVVANW